MQMTTVGPPVPQIGTPQMVGMEDNGVTHAKPANLPPPPAAAVTAPIAAPAQRPALPPPPTSTRLPPPHPQTMLPPPPQQQLNRTEPPRPALPVGPSMFRQTPQCPHHSFSVLLIFSVNADGAPIVPIKELTPYTTRWTIRCRVAFKTPIKHYENTRGPGRVASVDLLDSTGDIRCTLFNEAIDQFYDLLVAGQVFTISKGVLKPDQRDKKYSNTSNTYDMSLNQYSVVQPFVDDGSVPSVKIATDPIAHLNTRNPDDVVGSLPPFHSS